MGSWNNSAKGDGTAAVNGAVGWTFYLTKISVRLPLTPMLKWWISNWMCKSEIHKGEQGQIRYFRICSLQMVLVWDNLQRMVDRNSNWAKSSALGHFYIYSIKCKPSSQIFRVRHSQKHVYCFSLNHFLKKEITILQLSQNIQKELEGYFSFFIEQRQKKNNNPEWTSNLIYKLSEQQHYRILLKISFLLTMLPKIGFLKTSSNKTLVALAVDINLNVKVCISDH